MEEDQYDVYRPSVMLFSVFLPTLDSVQSFVISGAVCADAAAPPSMVLVEAKKGGAAGLSVTPALLVYSEASHVTETDRFKKIYEDCAF